MNKINPIFDHRLDCLWYKYLNNLVELVEPMAVHGQNCVQN